MKNEIIPIKAIITANVLFVILIIAAHIFTYSFLEEKYRVGKTLYIHLFHFLFLALAISLTLFAKKNSPQKVGVMYLVVLVLKFLGSLLFLLPWIINKDESSLPFVFHFMGIFFSYLAWESIFIILKILPK